jgi:hypothetical protein
MQVRLGIFAVLALLGSTEVARAMMTYEARATLDLDYAKDCEKILNKPGLYAFTQAHSVMLLQRDNYNKQQAEAAVSHIVKVLAQRPPKHYRPVDCKLYLDVVLGAAGMR